MKQIYRLYDREENQAAGWFKYCPYCSQVLVMQEDGQQLRPTCPACGFVQFKNPAPAVTVLVVQEGKVLLGRRRFNPGAGQWALPSGYIEYDEDFLTTARREVLEETGLIVQIKAIINNESAFTSPQFHFLAVYLLAEVVGGELRAGDDCTAVAWYPLTGPLPDMAFPQDVDLVAEYAHSEVTGIPIDPADA